MSLARFLLNHPDTCSGLQSWWILVSMIAQVSGMLRDRPGFLLRMYSGVLAVIGNHGRLYCSEFLDILSTNVRLSIQQLQFDGVPFQQPINLLTLFLSKLVASPHIYSFDLADRKAHMLPKLSFL